MAVTPMYFQPLSFQQASPITSGMQVGSEVMANAFKNALLRQQTQSQQIQNQWMPQINQADIGLKGAQTGLANAQAQWFPVTAQAQLYNGLGRMGMANNGITSNFIKWLASPDGIAYAQKNPDVVKNAIASIDRTGAMAAGGMPMLGGILGGMPNTNMGMQSAQQPSMQIQAPAGASPQQLPQPPGQVAQLNQQLGGLAQNGDPTAAMLAGAQQPSNQNTIAAMQDAMNSSLQSKTVPKPILQQRLFAQSADNLLKQVAPDMATITQFAGAAGKLNLTLDKYAAATGQQSSPEYLKANNFLTTQMPIIVNEVRRGLGGQATDSEREEMKNVSNPVFWKNSPQAALSQFNSLVSSLSEVNKALVQSPSQTVGSLQQGIQNPPYAQQQISKSIGGKSYTKINGKWYQQ